MERRAAAGPVLHPRPPAVELGEAATREGRCLPGSWRRAGSLAEGLNIVARISAARAAGVSTAAARPARRATCPPGVSGVVCRASWRAGSRTRRSWRVPQAPPLDPTSTGARCAAATLGHPANERGEVGGLRWEPDALVSRSGPACRLSLSACRRGHHRSTFRGVLTSGSVRRWVEGDAETVASGGGSCRLHQDCFFIRRGPAARCRRRSRSISWRSRSMPGACLLVLLLGESSSSLPVVGSSCSPRISTA